MTTLIVELADEQMRVLERVAEQRGLSVPALMSDLAEQYTASQSVANGSKAIEDVESDPLWKACGAITSETGGSSHAGTVAAIRARQSQRGHAPASLEDIHSHLQNERDSWGE